jgi:hypothetical protein
VFGVQERRCRQIAPGLARMSREELTVAAAMKVKASRVTRQAN